MLLCSQCVPCLLGKKVQGSLPGFTLIVALIVRRCPRNIAPVLISDNNTSEFVRATVKCWSEKVTSVLEQQSAQNGYSKGTVAECFVHGKYF